MTCYRNQAQLIFGKTVILSWAGFHQGDPLASLLFSLGLHPIIKRIAEAVPNLLLNEWYLDDGGIVGSLAQLREVVDIVLQSGPARGLHLSTAKSTVWNLRAATDHDEHQDPLSRGIRMIREPGTILLGAPVGSVSFEKQAIQARVGKVQEIVDRLPLLKDPQSEYSILRSCLSQPKVMFNLRTINPVPHQKLWEEFDAIIREALCRILGASLSQQQWVQATLTVAVGGLGLRAAGGHCFAAYTMSLLCSHDLKLEILGRSAEECPPVLAGDVLDRLQAKTGR